MIDPKISKVKKMYTGSDKKFFFLTISPYFSKRKPF